MNVYCFFFESLKYVVEIHMALHYEIKKIARTLLKSKANGAILNLFSSGSICFASGNLMPTNKGFRENISLCLFINAPDKKTQIFSEILAQHP